VGGADSMAISGLSFRNTLVGSGWANFCPPMHKQAEKTVLSHFTVPISGREAFSPSGRALASQELVTIASCWRRAVDYCKLLMGGCGLSYNV